MAVSSVTRESRSRSSCRFWLIRAWNRRASASTRPFSSSSAALLRDSSVYSTPTTATTTTQAPITPSNNGSLTFSARAEKSGIWKPVVATRFFLGPGSRLISIIGSRSPSIRLPQGEAHRQHQERGDLVHVQRAKRTLSYPQALQRVSYLDRHAQPLAQHRRQAGDPRAAAGAIGSLDRPGLA